MPRELTIKGVRVRRKGLAGLVLEYEARVLCVDPGSDATGCDYTLCTHLHDRHCAKSLLQWSGVQVLSPLSSEVRPGSAITFGGVEVIVVDAYNRPEMYAGNPPHPKGLGVGYVILFPTGLELYHMGDTNLVDELLGVCKANLMALVPPIGGGCVMTPEEALEAVKTIRPAVTIPVHWDRLELFYKFRDISQPYTQVVRMG